MELFQENTTKQTNKRNKTLDIIENFSQRKSINEDLQNLWFMLFNIKNSLLKTWLEETLQKNKVDNDSYRCFINIFNFINSYELNNLTNLVNYYKELYMKSESKLIHWNEIKREQIKFLKKTFEYLLWDFLFLKERILNNSLIFIKENAFRKPINQEYIQEMNLFLNEFSSRINSSEEFLNKIYSLWSNKTKDKLEEYKKIDKYL